jgi:hypothetical protein
MEEQKTKTRARLVYALCAAAERCHETVPLSVLEAILRRQPLMFSWLNSQPREVQEWVALAVQVWLEAGGHLRHGRTVPLRRGAPTYQCVVFADGCPPAAASAEQSPFGVAWRYSEERGGGNV